MSFPAFPKGAPICVAGYTLTTSSEALTKMAPVREGGTGFAWKMEIVRAGYGAADDRRELSQ